MVLPALSVQIMIYCCKNCVMTDQHIITDENAALVLKMTAVMGETNPYGVISTKGRRPAWRNLRT